MWVYGGNGVVNRWVQSVLVSKGASGPFLAFLSVVFGIRVILISMYRTQAMSDGLPWIKLFVRDFREYDMPGSIAQ